MTYTDMPRRSSAGVTPFASHTRAELERLADQSLLALRPWSTPGRARFELPGPAGASGRIVDGVEAFARSFLAAGFRLSAADADPYDHAGWYATGIAAAVDPSSDEHWPSLRDEAQPRVEAAAFAVALHESRAWIWDRLSPKTQGQVVDWFAGSTGAWYPDNNWRWFHNIAHAFLRSVGAPHDQSRIEENLDYLDACLLGDGWYRDGHDGGIDWYAGWVMQQLSLWYCRMSAGEPGIEERQARYARGLSTYIEQVAELFGTDGAPLYQGRSLVYRYATVGALWTSAVFDASPMPLGRLRRIAMRGIDYHLRRHAFNENDLLTLGWHDEFIPMRQSYSGPGSPYWANLGLAGLVLPEGHALWTDPEEPALLEVEDRLIAMPAIGWISSGTTSDGIVRASTHGIDHGSKAVAAEWPQYSRFGYSTVTAPVPLEAATEDGALDNQVALIDSAGRSSQRSVVTAVDIRGHRAESRHTAGFENADGGFDSGPTVRTVSFLRGPVEVRAARIESESHVQALVISGYAVPGRPAPGARVGLVARVVGLTPGGAAGMSVHDHETPFGSEQRVEWCRFDRPESGSWYVAAIGLGDREVEWPSLTTGSEGEPVIVWADGSTDTIR